MKILYSTIILLLFSNLSAAPLSLSSSDWSLYPTSSPSTVISNSGPSLVNSTTITRPNSTYMHSNYTFNALNSVVTYEWSATGGSGYNYAAFYLGIASNNANFDIIANGDTRFYTTHHSYSSSYLIQDNTHYFTTIAIDGSGNFVADTSTGNFTGLSGSTTVRSYASSNNSVDFQTAKLFAGLHDNYSSGAQVTIYQANIASSSAVPEPSTYALMLLALGSLFYIRKRKK